MMKWNKNLLTSGSFLSSFCSGYVLRPTGPSLPLKSPSMHSSFSFFWQFPSTISFAVVNVWMMEAPTLGSSSSNRESSILPINLKCKDKERILRWCDAMSVFSSNSDIPVCFGIQRYWILESDSKVGQWTKKRSAIVAHFKKLGQNHCHTRIK